MIALAYCSGASGGGTLDAGGIALLAIFAVAALMALRHHGPYG